MSIVHVSELGVLANQIPGNDVELTGFQGCKIPSESPC